MVVAGASWWGWCWWEWWWQCDSGEGIIDGSNISDGDSGSSGGCSHREVNIMVVLAIAALVYSKCDGGNVNDDDKGISSSPCGTSSGVCGGGSSVMVAEGWISVEVIVTVVMMCR